MKFSFTLQRVFELKIQMEEQLKIELSRLNEKKKEIHNELKKLKEKLLNLQKDTYSKEKIQGIEILLLSEFREYLLQDINKKETELYKLEEKIKEKEKEVLEAVKERKKLEKLRERAFSEFLIEEKRTEQKELDEYAFFKREIF